MDFNDYWQENKRFLTTVGAGLLVFLIAWMVIDNLYAGDISSLRSQVGRNRSELGKEMYTADDLRLAESENDALAAAFDELEKIVAFVPRPEFQLDPAAGSPQSQYFTAVERVRERLAVKAGRQRSLLPPGLDLEMIKTANVEMIERHLHALDLLDRAVDLALDAGVKSIKRIRIELDSAFRTRRGRGPIERTNVEIEVVTSPVSLAHWIHSTQTNVYGQVLPIMSVEARRANAKDDEARAKVSFAVVRVEEPNTEEIEE